MSDRWEPRNIPERIAWIEEFIRRWEITPAAAATLQADTPCQSTLLHHVPGSLTVQTYEAYAPLFPAIICRIRGNVATAPSGGNCEFDLLIDGVSAFGGVDLPHILDGATLGESFLPDVAAWGIDSTLAVQVTSINGATGLVVAIEHTRLA